MTCCAQGHAGSRTGRDLRLSPEDREPVRKHGKETRPMTNRTFNRVAMAVLAMLVPALLISCGDTDTGLSRAEVEEIVREEMANAPAPPEPAPGLTAAEVEEAIRAALADMPQPDAGLSHAEVEEIVRSTMADVPATAEPGLSRVEVEQIVQSAIAAIPTPQPGLTSADVENAIRAALADMPQPDAGLSQEEVERIARGVVATIPPRSAPIEYTKFFVDKAISRYETQGLDATLAHYNREQSIDGQWYVFIVDENDLAIGHPDPDRIGLDLKGWVSTDANGYDFGPEMLSATGAGKWVSYVYQNPESGRLGSDHTGAMQLKNAWVVKHDGLLFASGWYVNADEFTKSLVSAAVNKFRSAGLEATIAYFTGPESVFSGLAATIEYYNSADTVEGEWFAFIADSSGKIVDHYDKAMVGTDLKDLLGTDMFEATAAGNWVTTESIRVWVVGYDGWVFASGWRNDESG